MKPLKLCLLWHQHQPYYRAGNQFLLPWAWLHATKDYLEMAQHLERHPKMKATINLVPSLIKQLDEYLSPLSFQGGGREVVDPVVTLMVKDASDLTDVEKVFMLENFFRANEEMVIARSVRYSELYDKAFHGVDPASQPSSFILHPSSFSLRDYLDLAVHYSLAWTGAIERRTPPFASLIARDSDFTEADKQVLYQAQIRNVARIIPLHKKLAQRGQVELTTTPFYHPILPLLVDTDSALEAMPYAALPEKRFAHPEEADHQLQCARTFFKTRLGIEPNGLWPSEGSVSQDVLALIRKNGFEWTATDEGVLVNTIKDAEVKIGDVAIDPQHAKYFPWRAETPNGPITLFFRDHRLSDDIGFTYHSWNAKQAVEHFVGNLLHIRETLVKSYGEKILDDAVISVILDGENCWEYYPDNGFEFLDTLYSSLSVHKLIAPVTFSEALAIADAKRIPLLPRIVAGSWINANFRIWIGHPEDNAAWDAVAAAKDAYDRMQTRATTLHGNARKSALAQLELAHEELMVAEGSDWCWWFGDEHQNAQSNIFDELFRLHLRAMYVHLDLTVPANLMRPIISVGDDNVAIDPSSADLHKFSSMHRADG